MPVTATQNNISLGLLRQSDKKSYLCPTAQGGQGKYCFMLLSPTVLLTNFANVNNP